MRGASAKLIKYMGHAALVVCDGRCEKAWGLNSRPREGDRYLADGELGTAPADPGTYEGEDAKPGPDDPPMNRWCVRECERSAISRPGEANHWLTAPDWSHRRSV